MSDIDFVIFWVDGSDPAWQAERRQHIPESNSTGETTIRYRDWRNLRYWFRGVERFAPWVRRIHFVTWGHLPKWLDTSNPRLHIVNHRDFIPAEFLPTFSSNTIELNTGNIPDLAERFVLFNDDTFLIRESRVEEFFRKGLPCDMARLCIVQPSSIGHTVYNNLELINADHRLRDSIRRNPAKWFSPRYGAKNLLKSISLMVWQAIPGLYDHHMPQPYLKSQWRRAYEHWGDKIRTTCRNRTRSLADISDWVVRYDMLCRGEFSPRGFSDCRLMTIEDSTIEQISHDIECQRYRMVCINDSERISDFETAADRLCAAFEKILPQKSSYER